MYNALYTCIKETSESILCPCFTFAEEEDLVYPLNQIETRTVICSIFPVVCNVGSVKCNVDPVESSIDVDHVKFLLGLIMSTIMTPKVENEVLAEIKMKCWQRLSEVMAVNKEL